MILKPFLLRRVKRDVENELPEKIEITLPCRLSTTQQRLYKQLQRRIKNSVMLENTSKISQNNISAPTRAVRQSHKSILSSRPLPTLMPNQFSGPLEDTESLVTLVMQFRKVWERGNGEEGEGGSGVEWRHTVLSHHISLVLLISLSFHSPLQICNHPELYEKKQVLSPYYFGSTLSYPTTKHKKHHTPTHNHNHIEEESKEEMHSLADYQKDTSINRPTDSTPPPLYAAMDADALDVYTPAAHPASNPLSPILPSIIHNCIRFTERERLLRYTYNIYSADHVYDQLYHRSSTPTSSCPSTAFSFLPFSQLSWQELGKRDGRS